MMSTVERVGKRHFENVLCQTVRAQSLGLVDGEETYAVHLSEQVRVVIRSGIRASLMSDAADDDHIRLFIEVKAHQRWQAVGQEPASSTTCAGGWEQRLSAKLILVLSKARRISVDIQPDEAVCYSDEEYGRPFSVIRDGQTGYIGFHRWLDR